MGLGREHAGFPRCARRIKARAARSALAVTLQVFTTTTSDARGWPSASFRKRPAMASPSARAARQPKFSMEKPAIFPV